MKRIIAFSLAMLLLLLTGCYDSGDVAYDMVWSEMNTSDKESSSDSNQSYLSGELTITTSDRASTEYYTNTMDFYADLFMKQNPNVKVTVNSWDISNDMDYGSWYSKTITELYSGKGSDIYAVRGLPIESMGPRGLLVDLYYMMDQTEGFDRGYYYTNIWTAMEVGGKLYSTPSHFSYSVFNLNNKLVEVLGVELDGTISLYELADIWLQGMDAGLLPGNSSVFDSETDSAYFDSLEYVNYIDTATASYDFGSDTFFDYFDSLREFPFARDITNYPSVYGDIPDWAVSSSRVATIHKMISEPALGLNQSASQLLVNSQGESVFSPMNNMAIAATSKNQELAWEFIKFIIEEKQMTNNFEDENYYAKVEYGASAYNQYMPMNRNNYRQIADIISLNNTSFVDYVDGFNELQSVAAMSQPDIDQIVSEALTKYYSGESTREQCREELNEKLETFFGEW